MTHQILGVRFFGGTSREAVEEITQRGGLLVAPAAPSMIALCQDADYREAVLGAEIVIADSGFMVLLWKLFTAEAVPRISGLEHMKRLLEHPSLREPNAAVWVVATKNSREKLRTYLGQVQRSARAAPADATVEDANSSAEPMIYVAPQYVHPVTDPYLLALISEKHPRHVVIAVGGGIQDKLGRYLLGSLDYRPAVHCIGAALGFLTGDQVRIPDWADRYYVGWLFRSAAQPAVFIPRFWSARRLPWLIWKYRKQLPPLMGE